MACTVSTQVLEWLTLITLRSYLISGCQHSNRADQDFEIQNILSNQFNTQPLGLKASMKYPTITQRRWRHHIRCPFRVTGDIKTVH